MSGSKRRWYQFSIRSVLVLMTLAAISFGFWVSGVHRKHQALSAMRELKARIEFAQTRKSRFGEAWRRALKLVDKEYASEPVAISSLPRTKPFPNDAAVQSLADLPTLKQLTLQFTATGDEGMPYLRRLKNLEWLDLQRSQADDRALANVGGLSHLRLLNLSGTAVSDAGMHWLKNLGQVTDVFLSGTRVGDESLRIIAGLPELQHLSLSKTRVTGNGFAQIAECPLLTSLDLSGAALTDEGLMNLPRAPRLQSLKLNDTAITDEGVARLGRLTALQTLELRNTKITGRSLMHLQTLPRLTYLDLSGTQIGDTDIERLNEICSLVSVSLAGANVTQAGLARLQVIGSLEPYPAVLRGLAEPTEIVFNRQALRNVVDYLKQRHGCEIQFDARLVKAPYAPVTCGIRGVTLWRGLQELLNPLGLEVVFRYSVPYITMRPAKPALDIPQLADGETLSVTLAGLLAEKNELDFADQPLQDVVEYLHQYHNVEIRLDGDSLRRANIGTNVPITRTMKGFPLRSGLGLILEPLDLTCVAEGEALMIRSAAEGK